MVEEVVGQVVTNVAEDATGENSGCDVPVPVEDGMCQVIEWDSEDNEEGRRHDEAVAVHR